MLIGAVVFRGSDNVKSMGHYYSLAKRGNQFEAYDDLKNKVLKTKSSETYTIEVLVYSKFGWSNSNSLVDLIWLKIQIMSH